MSNILGILGDFLILLAFFLLQLEKVKSNYLKYLLMNLFGALLLLFSLFYYWNLPAVVIEVAWISISLFGIGKYILRKRRDKSASLGFTKK